MTSYGADYGANTFRGTEFSCRKISTASTPRRNGGERPKEARSLKRAERERDSSDQRKSQREKEFE